MPQSKQPSEPPERRSGSPDMTQASSQAHRVAYEPASPISEQRVMELVTLITDKVTEAFTGIIDNARDGRRSVIGERGLDPEQRHLINRFQALRALTGRRGAALVPAIKFTICEKQWLKLFKRLPPRTRVEVFASDHSYLGGATVSGSDHYGSDSPTIGGKHEVTWVQVDHVLDPSVFVEVYDHQQGHLKYVGQYVRTREDDDVDARSDMLA